MAKKNPQDLDRQIEHILSRNVEEVTVRDHLGALLRSGKKLRVKLGIDPTGSKIHIGRAVVLWKLREFQEMGHKVVLIVGDFTAQIGDASDKLSKRPFLSKKEVQQNLKNYLPQIGKIVDLKKAEVRYNSEWLSRLNFQEISQLSEIFSVQQMVERRNFRERWDAHEEISLREFLYPLMQGYDSVAVRADIELGGTDQLFNLLAGRKIQEHYGQKPQDVMTTQMLSGTDGRKMSTSWGNVINVLDPADDQYGKILAMHDSEILPYFRLATRTTDLDIVGIESQLRSGANPKFIKEKLAFEVVKLYHGEKLALKAADNFKKRFSEKDFSGELPLLQVAKKVSATDIILSSGVAKSKSEAWRLIQQGAFSVNEVPMKDPKQILELKGGEVLKIGKKNFFRAKI